MKIGVARLLSCSILPRFPFSSFFNYTVSPFITLSNLILPQLLSRMSRFWTKISEHRYINLYFFISSSNLNPPFKKRMLSKIYDISRNFFFFFTPTREKNLKTLTYVSLTLSEIYPETKNSRKDKLMQEQKKWKWADLRWLLLAGCNPILPRLKLVSSRPSPDRSPDSVMNQIESFETFELSFSSNILSAMPRNFSSPLNYFSSGLVWARSNWNILVRI